MNAGVTSDDSRRSSTVRYPFSASQLSPSPEGTLPPASFRSTEANWAMPGPAPVFGAASGAPSAAAVSRTGSSAEASGRGPRAGLEFTWDTFAARSMAGGVGGAVVEWVTSLGESSGGRRSSGSGSSDRRAASSAELDRSRSGVDRRAGSGAAAWFGDRARVGIRRAARREPEGPVYEPVLGVTVPEDGGP